MSNNIIIHDLETFGSHIPFMKSLSNTHKLATSMGMYSFQFFSGNNRSYKRTIISEKDIEEVKILQKKERLNIYTHCCLLYNLCGSLKDNCCWDHKMDTFNTIKKGIEYELSLTSNLDANNNGCVIHIGNWKNEKEGIDYVVKSLNSINFPKNSTLLLENSAGAGNSIGKNFTQLKKIYDNLNNKDNIKFCIDTCHTFSAGLYKFDSEENIDTFFKDFDSLFGLNKLGLIHFNDSMTEFNSKKDRHELISKGFIWKDIKVLKYMLSKINNLKIPTVLETEPNDIYIVNKINNL